MGLKFGIPVRTPENFKLEADKSLFFDVVGFMVVVVIFDFIIRDY